jgi:hypothetical protein
VLYADIKKEMELDIPFVPPLVLAGKNSCQYSYHRAVIDSLPGGGDIFITEGQMSKQTVQQQLAPGTFPPGIMPQTLIQDNRTFDGWRHI